MNQLEEMILKHEGLRLKPYKCSAGKLTIGIGHNLDDNGISEKIAYAILKEDIDGCVSDLNKREWFAKQNIPRQDALIDMCFNLGITRLLGFKMMIAALDNGEYEEAAKQALDSRWASQVGKRAIEITEMIKTGEYA